MSHDSGFRRKSHDVSTSHKRRGHRDQASRAFEERLAQQQKAKERATPTRSASAPAHDEDDDD